MTFDKQQSRYESSSGSLKEIEGDTFVAVTPFAQKYRINALRLGGGLLLPLLAVTSIAPTMPIAIFLMNFIGVCAIFTAIGGRAWSLLYINGRKNVDLVTSGPYSMTRNPLYFFSLIGTAGIGAQTGSAIATVGFVLFAYFAFSTAIKGEEKYLARQHGRKFYRYKRSTPRLIPNISLWRESDDTLLRSRGALASFKDGAVFLVAWISVEGAKYAQGAGLLPTLFTLPF